MSPTKSSTRGSTGRKTSDTTKKTETKKKTSARRKYGPEAGGFVREEMEEMKEGKLKSGGSGKTVHNPKQAIAIGLSEARRSGVKVPQKRGRKAA
jgi:Family of unknown function (DUF6496)